MPCSVRRLGFCLCKNCHGALVKVQEWIYSFDCLKKLENVVSGICRFTKVKGTSVWKKDAKKDRKKSIAADIFAGAIFDQNRLKIDSKIHPQNDHQQTWNLMPKVSQNGANIDATTHQNSMPKLVTKKIRNIIDNHLSLNGKNIKIHLKK